MLNHIFHTGDIMKHWEDNFFGSSTIGERGQIVIPQDARSKMSIKAGDKFIFFGHENMLHMVKADHFEQFIDKFTSKLGEKIKSTKNKK